jgi:hypothetical protein
MAESGNPANNGLAGLFMVNGHKSGILSEDGGLSSAAAALTSTTAA